MFSRNGLFGSALIYTLSNAANAAMPIVLLPFLTRVLKPAEYGSVALFSSLLVVLGAFVGANTHSAIIVRFFELNRDEMNRYVASLLIVGAVTFPLVFAVVAAFREPLAVLTGIPGSWILVAVAVSAAQFVVQIVLSLWQTQGQPVQYGVLRFSQAALDLAMTISAITLLNLTLEGRLSGIAAAWLLMLPISLLILRHQKWLNMSFRWKYVKDSLRFGVPLIPHIIGTMLIFLADRFLISQVLGTTATGNYVVSMQVAMLLSLMADAVNKAFAPWLLEKLHTSNLRRDLQIVKYTYGYFLFWIAFAVGFGLLMPFVIKIIVGDRYLVPDDIVLYHSLGIGFGAMYYMVANYVFFSSSTGKLSIITIACGVFNMTLTYFLLQTDGLAGAAKSFMLSQLLMFLLTWILAHKCRPMPWFGHRKRA